MNLFYSAFIGKTVLLGINKDNNIDPNGNLIEDEASGTHSNFFDLDAEEVWGDGWE
jgi:hypothetical protein